MSATDGDGGRTSWLGRLRAGLGRSSAKLGGGITELFSRRKLDAAAIEELEDLLIGADLGVAVAARLSGALKARRFDQDADTAEIRAALADDVENDQLRQLLYFLVDTVLAPEADAPPEQIVDVLVELPIAETANR